MTDTIEPTEEQKQAAADCYEDHYGDITVEHIARLLAEREHKATAYWRANEAAARADAEIIMEQCRAHDATLRASFMRDMEGAEKLNAELRADLDAARARIAELEKVVGRFNANASTIIANCDRGALGNSHVEESFKRFLARCEEAHLKRIAELEAQCAASIEDQRHQAQCYVKREASHLAHIKALHQFLGDREEQEGIWIPRAEFKDIPKHDTAHYDVEGGEG